MTDIINTPLITGEKKGKKKPKPPYMAPITARSTSKMKLLYALSEGEVEASGMGVLSSRDIYLDDVPITNQDGTNNYDVIWEFRKGVQNQEHINSLPTVENLQQVGFKVTTRNPYIHNLQNNNLDQVRVNLSFPALQRATDKGDYYATTVEYAIDIATGAGGYVEVGKFKLHERFTSEYNRSHEFDLPESDSGWRVRVRRLTPDSDSMLIQDEFSVAAITEVIDAKLRYPNTALLYLEFDAEAFPQVPKVSVKMKGKVVRVPDNYNTEDRTYSGVWSGRWKWGYTNNPVWCLLDVLLSETYGAGERIGLDQIDKWNFYRVAQWCDIRVPDGMGGEEPRHSLNVYLQKQTDAWRLLQDICSNFNGGLYWNGVQIEIFADIPSPIEYVYNQSNIVSGTITDAGINQKNKFSHALVKWDNPAINYETDTTATYDINLTRRHGVRTKDVAAFGVTSQGEAQRKGKWVLMENTFSRYSSFEVGLDGYIPRVGSVVGLVNNRLAGANISGRIKNVLSKRKIELDRECRVSVGDRLILNLPNGVSETRTVSSVEGNVITVSVNYTETPKQGLAFNIDSDTLAVQKVRVLKSEQKGDTFLINVVEYNDSKQDYIDNGALIEKPPLTITPVTNQLPPTNLIIDQYETIEQGLNITHLVFKWNRAENAVTYEVSWSKDEGEWINISPTPNSEVTVSGVYSGVYQFSVRAVNAVGVTSQQVYSGSKYISGKIGEVQPLAFLRTTSEVMGIRLDWGFKERSEDSSKTIIMMNTHPDDVGSTLLAELSYPTDTYTHRGLAHARELYYKGRVEDKLGNKSKWTDWIHGSSSADADEILSYLDGQISNTHLDQWLKEEISKIDEIEDIQAKIDELESIIQDLEDVEFFDPTKTYSKGDMVKFDNVIYAAKKDVPAGKAPPNPEYWDEIGGFDSLNEVVAALAAEVRQQKAEIIKLDGQVVSLSEQQNVVNSKITDLDSKTTANASGISKLNTRVETTEVGLKATSEKVDGVYSTIKPDMAGSTTLNAGSTQARAGVFSVWSAITEHDLAQTRRVDQAYSEIADNTALIKTEETTRATQVEAMSKRVDTLQATVDDDIKAAIQDVEEVIATETEALGKRISTVQAGVDSNKSAIQTEAQTRANADGALSQRIDTVQATTGSNSASIQSIQQAQASTDGKLNAMHGVKLQLAQDGQWVNAGYTIGIDGQTMQSTTIFDTNNFLIRNGVNGQSQTMFAVQGNQTIIRSALIGDATITMAKIGGDLYSTDYVEGVSGWRLQKDGTFEINSTVAGEGRVQINNKGMRVFDENGRIRVKMGDLR